MDESALKNKIKQLNPWYQRIKIGNLWTTSRKSSSPELWKQIEELLPSELNGLRILDLGCNAGAYCCKAAIRGAEVVGINIDGLRRRQAEFIKDYFEKEYNIKLNITYIWKAIEEVDFEVVGRFDYVFALAILYHLGVNKYERGSKEIYEWQKDLISRIKTDKFIVRMRPGQFKNVEFYDKFFGELGFVSTKHIKKYRRLALYEREVI